VSQGIFWLGEDLFGSCISEWFASPGLIVNVKVFVCG
jgi:hypothetical protein